MFILGAEKALENKMKAVLQEFGYKGSKARVVCKCNSIEEANEKAKRAGLGSRWFEANCCEEIKEEERLDLTGVLKENDIAICMDGNNFLAVDSEVRDMLLK